MNELINIKNDEAVTTSLQVAESFGKKHQHVLEKIDKIVVENSTTKSMFKFSRYKANDNQMHRICYMNRDGFTLLVMGFNGKKAMEWKLKYISAFNSMEKIVREKSTATWIETRQQGKLTRKAETDTIKKLVEYAKEQGSTHADMLYMTYSKLANKYAGIGKRDNATVMQLNNLSLMEHIILNVIQNGIAAGMHYKEIYQASKQRLENMRDIAFLGATS